MSEFKVGNVVYHKGTNKRGVIECLKTVDDVELAEVDHGELDFRNRSETTFYPVTSLSLVESPDVLAQLADLQTRLVEAAEATIEQLVAFINERFPEEERGPIGFNELAK